MWRAMALQAFPGVELREPAREADLVEAGRRLGCELPEQLAQLLRASDGLTGPSSVDTIWPIAHIVEHNLLFRSDPSFAQLYMPFEPLLFFADNGGGDQFAFVQKPRRPDVFVWEHETDSRRWVAGDLRDYLERALQEDGDDDWYRL
ncbi:SMI1/KNR4 family protein [Streptomyces sp. NBC_00083]|uniref:SMI1/KNR4 family protein n=1 Tax=Streptomyces sp. NBC_00083 TaxID=2975647 RepID=UPI00224D232E|nr:SMI1/KNR4 family protein [Streptomyces sp. NBC_00083]MCX5384543.1 SMI1/KNR4 family protein [Streptomyces sp. NBC_00083]